MRKLWRILLKSNDAKLNYTLRMKMCIFCTWKLIVCRVRLPTMLIGKNVNFTCYGCGVLVSIKIIKSLNMDVSTTLKYVSYTPL